MLKLKFQKAMELLSTIIKSKTKDGYVNTDIEKFMTTPGICPSFQGVFSSDILPKEIQNGCLITNLSENGEFGTHFVTIVIKDHSILYIDPLGMKCEVEDIQSFLKKSKRSVLYNTEQIQSMFSNECGMFCMLFCLYFDQCYIMKKRAPFPLIFSKNREENDKICLKYVNKLVK